MRKTLAILLTAAFCLNLVQAAKPPFSWWPSFGFDQEKNAVCPWQFAPPITQDRGWDVTLPAGVWSQPVATDKFIAFVSDTDEETGKAGIHVYNLAEGFGKLRKSFAVDILPTAGLNKYDKPITTPALAMGSDGEPILVFGDGFGRLVKISGNRIISDGRLNNSEFGFGSSPTIHDGRVYISSDSGMTYIAPLEENKAPVEMRTTRIVTASPTVWGDFVMFGDNSGKFYIFNRTTGAKVREISIPGIDAIRSTACISCPGEKTYAVFGSNRGKIHRVRLDDKSFELTTLDANIGQTNTEFWATPTFADSFIYLGNENGYLYKIDCGKMTVVDRLRLDGNSIFSQAVISNGFLYVTTGNRISNPEKFEGALFIIDLSTFKAFQSFGMIPIDGGSYVSPVFAGGRLFVASRSGKIYCFKGMQPELKVEPQKVVFRQIEFDRDQVSPVKVTISNSIRYTSVDASISTDPPDGWLKVSKDKLSGNSSTIDCWVDLAKIPERSGRLDGAIIVESVFGLESKTTRIPVEATFETAPPKFILSKPLVSHRARELSKIVDPLKIQLRQQTEDSELSFEILTGDAWYDINKKLFTLSGKPGQSSIDIAISIDPEKLLKENPGKLEYSGSFTVQGIFRNKPYSPVTVKVVLTIEKGLTLIAIPEITDSERLVSRKIYAYDKPYSDKPAFVFTNASNSGEMSIVTPPAVNYGTSEIKDWIKLPGFPIQAEGDMLTLPLEVKLQGFRPGKTYRANLTVTFNTGKQFELAVEYIAIVPDDVKIRFVIGSTSYWVNDAVQQEKLSAPPYISRKGNTMVPIRPISEPLGFFYGAKIEWIGEIQTVLFTMGDKTLRLVINHNKAYIDNADGSIDEVPLSSPPEIVGGRTFIPPRIIADTFGGKSEWVASTKTVVFEFKKPR